MRLLREYIRALLTEAAMGPADLPEDVHVTIQSGDITRIFYSNEKGNSTDSISGRPLPIRGTVSIVPPGWGSSDAPCLGAWQVVQSQAPHGWGPLLYDVAMETVGDAGLMADRGSISSDAYSVWMTYASRGDVEKKQLDDEDDTLTPDKKDNCGADSALKHGWDEAESAESHLVDSPIMKVYTKGPTTIGELESMGRLIRK